MLESDFPALYTAQRAALHEAMIYVQQRYDPLGIIAGGSIIRGNGGPTSDFDIYVIHDKPYRQRIQKRFSGVPAEIFVNNAASVRSYFPSECKAGRPITAHILATGVPLLKRDEVVDQLIGEAHEWLKKRPDLTAAELLWKRYLIVDLLDNARDLLEDDPANASLFLHDAVRAMVDYAFLAVNRNLPRVKESITVLEQEQPAIGKLLRSYYEADHHQLRFSVAEQIAVQLLGTAEFFEWETEPERFPDI